MGCGASVDKSVSVAGLDPGELRDRSLQTTTIIHEGVAQAGARSLATASEPGGSSPNASTPPTASASASGSAPESTPEAPPGPKCGAAAAAPVGPTAAGRPVRPSSAPIPPQAAATPQRQASARVASPSADPPDPATLRRPPSAKPQQQQTLLPSLVEAGDIGRDETGMAPTEPAPKLSAPEQAPEIEGDIVTQDKQQQQQQQQQRETQPAGGGEDTEQQPQPRMVDCAVSLRFLMDFCSTVPEDMPTWRVVTDVIVPATRDRRCRYVEMIEPRHVGRCDYFISHRWATPFSHLVRYVRKHLVELGDVRQAEEAAEAATQEGKAEEGKAEEGAMQEGKVEAGQEAAGRKGGAVDDEGEEVPLRSADEVFVWCDIFAINQHPGQGQADDLAQLKDCVVTSAQTLLCLDDKGLVLTRIWCLYEIWNTVLAGGAPKLAVLGYDVNQDAFKEVYITLDVAEAQATVDSDRVRILDDIAASTGLQELNLVIKRALVESTEAEAENAQKVLLPKARDWKDFQRIMEAINKHTQMLTSVGRHQESARYGYVIQSVSEQWQKQQARTSKTGAAAGGAAANGTAAAGVGGGGEDAPPPEWHWSHYPRNPDLRQVVDRALIAERSGRYDAAMSLYREAVASAEQRQQQHRDAAQDASAGGEEATVLALDLAGCRLRLAVYLAARGFIEQACSEAGEPAARGFEDAAGPDSLTFASAACQVAVISKHCSNSKDLRERLLTSAYGTQEAQLGPDHPATLATLRERAELTYMTGDFPAGIELFHTLAVRMSGGVDLTAGAPDRGSAPLSGKALEVWYLLASYLGNQAGKEAEAIAVCRGLIPYKRRDYIQRLYDAVAAPGGEFIESATADLRRLRSLATGTAAAPAGTCTSTGAGAAGAGGSERDQPAAVDSHAEAVSGLSLPAPDELESLLRGQLDDPDDPRVDVVGHLAELVTWSTGLAKKGRTEDAVRLQWRIADVCRTNKQMGDTEMQLPSGKVKSTLAYERCLLLDLSVPGVAKVAARMLAERDATPANARRDSGSAAAAGDEPPPLAGDGDAATLAATAAAAPPPPAPYDGPGYLELIQEMGRLWGAQEYGPAEAVCRQIVAAQAAAHGAVSREVVDARRQLASLLLSAGRREEGVAEMRSALSVHERILQGKDPTMAQTIQALAHMLEDSERGEAEQLYRRAVALVEKVHGPVHSDVGMAMVSLGGFLMADPERMAEGQELLTRGMAIQQKFQEQQLARAKAF